MLFGVEVIHKVQVRSGEGQGASGKKIMCLQSAPCLGLDYF
jgi:hypothetical protein